MIASFKSMLLLEYVPHQYPKHTLSAIFAGSKEHPGPVGNVEIARNSADP